VVSCNPGEYLHDDLKEVAVNGASVYKWIVSVGIRSG
jgi:hypothetical protein